MYDWANSVYSLVISTAIFPIFYEAQTTATYLEKTGLKANEIEPNDVTIDFFGYNVSPSVLYSLVSRFLFYWLALFLQFFQVSRTIQVTRNDFFNFSVISDRYLV